MAKNFTEDWLKQKGLVPDGKGNYTVPSNKNGRYGNSDNLIVKEKVNDSKDFSAKITIEWFIRGRIPAKKNSRQNFIKNGRQISIPSKKHQEYVQLTKMQYDIFGIEFKRAVKHYNLQYPLNVEFTFYRDTKHSWDYTNILQSVEDLMKENKRWIDDDSSDHLFPVFRPYIFDKNNPGVRIKLLIN